LVKEFIDFLPDNTDLNAESNSKRGSDGTFHELEMFFKIKMHLTKEGKYKEFVKLMDMLNRDILTKHQFSVMSQVLFLNNVEFWNWLNQFLDILVDEGNNNNSQNDNMDIDANDNYIPEKETIRTSGRSEQENLLLNNSLVSKRTVRRARLSSDQDFEDKLVKWDLQLEWNNQAIITLTDIQNRLEILTQEEKEKVTLDLSSLTVFHMKAMKALYGNQFSEVKKFLSANPAIAIPIILKRLVQKKNEWESFKYQDEPSS